jgi:hypothetical protein
MPIRGMNPDAIREFTPQSESVKQGDGAAPSTATVFMLRTLSVIELADALDSTQEIVTQADGSRSIAVRINNRNLKLIEAALVGWRNFSDERGNPLQFESNSENPRRPRASRRSLEALPQWLVRELARDIMGDSALSEQEAKNFDASPGERSAFWSGAESRSGHC